ncbi:MAG: hypothetical protein Q9219_002358 [cf. Caloplaca sp. 3 TL-2023]
MDQSRVSERNGSNAFLPELLYSLWNHKRNIAIIWFLLALDTTILPLALFYPLWYTEALIPAHIFAVTTSVFGIISGLEWAYRTWRLWREENVRPLGGKKKWFDFFHISYTIGYTLGLIELIVGAAPHEPIIRLCAMPVPTFVLFFGTELMLFAVLDAIRAKAPIRISSIPRGSRMRPGLYTIIEDVIAVDTGTGRHYREAINAHYEAGPKFRRMLRQLTWFWAVSALFVGGGVSAVVWIQSIEQTAAYGIGWGVPPAWTIIWVPITILYACRCLRKEKAAWYDDPKA